jgi:pectinesterase
VKLFLLIAATLLLPACAVPRAIVGNDPAARPAAVVDASYAGDDGALVNRVPTFATIGAALAAAPPASERPHVISVRDGRYYEKLSVDKPNIALVGQSRDGTVLTFDAAAGHPRPDGQGTWGTRGSFTLRITAPDFRLEKMTIENGFDYPANAAKAEDDPTRLQGAQAVAVLTQTGSDRAVFTDCVLSGYQDTLFADAGRSYFHRCTILGHVDFIFGAGQAVFDDSDIVTRDRGSATNNGFIAAPSTLKSQPYGFLFVNSRLRKEHPDIAPGSVTLGRPWRPGGNPQSAGSAVYVNVHMDDHIAERGWDPMAGFPPEEARLFEYGSTGPGAIASPARRVLSDAEVEYYTVNQVLRGWNPFSR